MMAHNTLDDISSTNTSATAPPKRCAGYTVYDPLGQKIGNAEEVFVNRDGDPEYVRLRVGLFGRKSVLIPVQFAEVDEEGRRLVLK